MASPEQFYPLLPLEWWQQPQYVGALVASLCTVAVLLFLCARRYRNRRTIYSTRTYLLHRAQFLESQALSKADACASCYIEMMRIVRDVACYYYGVNIQGLTDEEFFEALQGVKERMSPTFVEYIEQLCQEACLVKFAASAIAPADMKLRIEALIEYIQQLPDDASLKNT